jgi:hypothetical protein
MLGAGASRTFLDSVEGREHSLSTTPHFHLLSLTQGVILTGAALRARLRERGGRVRPGVQQLRERGRQRAAGAMAGQKQALAAQRGRGGRSARAVI